MPKELPDFLRLPKKAREAERERQDSLRRDFNSRARQSGVEIEAARAQIIEGELKASLKLVQSDAISNRLADVLAQQGRFTEAATYAVDPHLKEFCEKAAEAIFDGKECDCMPQIGNVGNTRLKMPKYRVIREVYSMKASAFGYLIECQPCGNWTFSRSNPIPSVGDGKTNDLVRLKA